MPGSLQKMNAALPNTDFPVVGIGASAGGLEAFKRFLASIPEVSGMAYVFVQHLNPEHESALSLILRKISKIPVEEITSDIHLQPDHLYVIPSNKMLSTSDGMLKIQVRNESNHNIKIIDHFFSSLGIVYQAFAAGVVLSGTLSDGSLGLSVIKAHGGVTFAQDPETAAYDDMPKNAIKTGVVDFILPPEKIFEKLSEINRQFGVPKPAKNKSDRKPREEGSFRTIISMLKTRRGFDFSYYKLPTLKRRIARRMAMAQTKNAKDYLKQLRENKEELNALFDDMLISVSAFFRDAKSFESLAEKVIPAILTLKSADQPIRVWVAGCATGEEPYSLAICLTEAIEDRISASKVQVFATDISERAIAKARLGIYKKEELSGISTERLHQFFTKLDGDYQINKSIRERCVFAQHNFLKDPPFSKIDLISCRNVLIYLEPVLQKRALVTFHYALNEKGFLVLGKSETIGSQTELFKPFGSNSEKIYSRYGSTHKFMQVASLKNEEALRDREKRGNGDRKPTSDIFKKADDAILSKYSLPGVLINDQLEIVQFRGATDAWLSPSPGKASFNLLKMARQGLSFELRNLLNQVKSNNAPAKKNGIQVNANGKPRYVSIEVFPLADDPEPHYLVMFQDQESYERPKTQNTSPENHGEVKVDNSPLARRVEQLEKELLANREDMRNITEAQEASNEELQSANEELLSSSEELQSLNEELETSKEELQSSNEELTIVNHELLDRNEQLINARKYAESIVRTIRDPLLVLDKNFIVKNATKGFYKKFLTTEYETEGKYLFELSGKRWNIEGLRNKLENEIPETGQLFDFEIAQDFPIIGNRNLIINAHRDNFNGNDFILLAIEDITDRKRAEEAMAALKQLNKKLENSNQELEQFAFIASHDLQEPLRKILTFSDFIEEKMMDIPPETKTYIEKIISAGKRMEKLIRDLLNFSLANDKTKGISHISLNTLMQEVLNDLELTVREKEAVIHVADLPDIEGITVQIHQLFYNLVSNALKFSSTDRQPKVEIQSRPLNADDLKAYPQLKKDLQYLDITVFDNGIGLDQEYADKIFIIFQRLNPVSNFPGTGIGLALCRKIVQNHSGEIFVQSEKGKGSVFHVILPNKQ